MKSTAIIHFFYLIFITNPLFSQPRHSGYPEDVQSIDAIINACYDVISGSSDQPWQFERDKFLHTPNTQIYRLSDSGLDVAHSLEAEYIPFLLAEKEDFYEIEVSRITHQYGNMAQVFSTYEIRTDPKIETGIFGINSIQLYYAEGRWWIANWMTQMESDEPIPAKYLNK